MRNDIHRPSAIEPNDYQFVAAIATPRGGEFTDGHYLSQQRQAIADHMAHTGGKYSKHGHGGDCHVCGAWFVDFAVFYHIPSNTYIRTGFDCADKLDGGDARLFRKVRDERQAMERSRAGKLKAQGILRERGLLERVLPLTQPNPLPESVKGNLLHRTMGKVDTVIDLHRKLVSYGDLSDKQWDFFGSLLDQIERAEEIQAERDAEDAKAADAPEGRVTVTGTVLSLKTQDSDYGPQFKMLLKTDDGYKVWTTEPKGLNPQVGDKVQLTATLQPSSDDPKFAFGKRPSKASIIN